MSVLNIPVARPDIRAGLIVHWSFDDGTGKDDAGARNQGTLINGPVPAAGIVPAFGGGTGGALSFNGSNQYVLTSNIPPITNPGTNLQTTISAWIKINGNPSYPGAQIGAVLDVANGGAAAQSVLRVTTGGTVDFWNYAGGGSFPDTTSAGTVTDNKWHHVVGVYNNVTQDVYIDGKRDGTVSIAPSANTNSTPVFQVNGSNSTGFPASYWAGQMDDIRLYNRGLQPGEINALYNMAFQPWMENELPAMAAMAASSSAVPFVSVWWFR